MRRVEDTPEMEAAREELHVRGMLWLSAPAGWAVARRLLAPVGRQALHRPVGPDPHGVFSEVRARLGDRGAVFVLQGLGALYGRALVEALQGITDVRTAIGSAPAERAWVVVRSELPQSWVLRRIAQDEAYLLALGRLPPENLLARAHADGLSRRLEMALDGHPRLVELALAELQRGMPMPELEARAVELARPLAETAVASIRAHAPSALEMVGAQPASLDTMERDALARWDLLRVGDFEGQPGTLRLGPPALREAVRRLV